LSLVIVAFCQVEVPATSQFRGVLPTVVCRRVRGGPGSMGDAASKKKILLDHTV